MTQQNKQPETSSMSRDRERTIEDVARETGRYPVEAFEFLRQGLDYTVERTHGETATGVRRILGWLEKHDASMEDLPQLAGKGKAPIWLLELLEKLGGVDSASHNVNLHVGGRELCEGLRELATKQWGLMAPAVLAHWGIHSTLDFGKMVFALVQNGFLQKQPQDCIDDFKHVYDFDVALSKSYRIMAKRPEPVRAEPELEVEADE
jgi:uncharacterized repeat protein (TIGR04138 family)